MSILDRKRREQRRRQQQILIAANRAFNEKGYTNATMSDIAKEAELSPGTLYLYFENKEDLFLSLSFKIFSFLKMRLKHVQNEKNELSIDKRIEKIFDSLFNTYDYNPRILVFTLNLQGSDIFSNESKKMAQKIRDSITEIIDHISELLTKDSGEPKTISHAKALSNLIWSHFTGVVLVNNVFNSYTHRNLSHMQKAVGLLASQSLITNIDAQ